MSKIYFALLSSLFLITACDSTSSTTQVDPHSAAHSKVHQDYIDEKEAKNNNSNNKNSVEAISNKNEKFIGKWHIIEVNDVKVDPRSFKYETPNIELITSKNMAAGHDGCNRFNVSIQINDVSISFGPIMSTMMTCKDNNKITDGIRSSLSEKEITYLFENDLLVLIDNDQKIMVLSKN